MTAKVFVIAERPWLSFCGQADDALIFVKHIVIYFSLVCETFFSHKNVYAYNKLPPDKTEFSMIYTISY